MKKITLITSVILLSVFSAFTISNNWNVKSEVAAISFEMPDEGSSGTISGLKASIDFDEKDLVNSKITASVEVKSLKSGDEMKDSHLKTRDFFDAEKFPAITFTSTKIELVGSGYIATGTLAIKDSVKMIEMPFTFENKDKEGIFRGSFSIFCGDFGIMKKSKSGKDKVIIKLQVPVTK